MQNHLAGFLVFLVYLKVNMIVAGHTRYKAAKKLGITDIPCISADDLSDEQIKAFRLADNKTAELAEWDEDLLGKEMQGIINIDMSQFGFSGKPMEVSAKIRYSHKGAPCVIEEIGEDLVQCHFSEPVRAVTPGQAVVFYDGDYVVGGGTIIR